MLIRLVVVSLFHLQRPLQFTRIIEFCPFSFIIPADCCIYCDVIYPCLSPSAFLLLLCLLVCFCGPLWPLSFPAEVKCTLEPSSAHLCPASAVMVTATAAESTPPTPPSVAEAFVMVLVGFGVVWGGWGRCLEAADHGGCRPWSDSGFVEVYLHSGLDE